MADDAFASRQLSLFQGFLANTNDQREALSNAVDLWDSIPRYAISRLRMNKLRTQDGFLSVMEFSFNYRSRPLTARIYPAQVKDGNGRWLRVRKFPFRVFSSKRAKPHRRKNRSDRMGAGNS